MIIRGRDYDFTRAISRDPAAPVRYEPSDLAPIIQSVLKGDPFEAAEFTLAGYMILRDRGPIAFTAIPIFPARSFFHACLWVRADSPLRSFADLAGKRLGLRDYTSTTSVWFRGVLKESDGVDWKDITWVVGPNRRFPPPAETRVETASGDLEDLLVSGDIDAFFSIRTRDQAAPEASRALRPLLADPQAEERLYLRRAFFPLLHVTIISEAVPQSPGQDARAVFDAYVHAKRTALAGRPSGMLLPWANPILDPSIDVFEFGLTDCNRRNLATLANYLLDQKLIRTLPNLDALFWPGSSEWPAG